MAVLVTRPDERGKALVDQLNQAGVVALHLPLLSIDQNGIGSSGRPGYDDGQCQHVAG